jgi:hypothetical protein
MFPAFLFQSFKNIYRSVCNPGQTKTRHKNNIENQMTSKCVGYILFLVDNAKTVLVLWG